MNIEQRQKAASKRGKRIRTLYAELKRKQPLATKTAILNYIANKEGVSMPTALRAVNGAEV